jgi:uncharacterized membrane protein
MMAYVLLNEDVNATQWLGIVLIILLIDPHEYQLE